MHGTRLLGAQVLSLLRSYQRVVTHDKMASALESFEREVRAQMSSASLLTFGGAFRAALPVLRQYLVLSRSTSAPPPGGPNPQGEADEAGKLKRAAENKDKQIANLKRQIASGGGRFYNGRQRGNNFRNNNFNNNPNNNNSNVNNNNRNTGTNVNNTNNTNNPNGGKRNAGNNNSNGGASNSQHGTSDGTTGPSGYARMMGGNPQNPETCPDWRNNTCHLRRNFCDRKHAN